MSKTYPITDKQLEAIYSLVDHIIETERDDWRDRLQEGDISDPHDHIYAVAITAHAWLRSVHRA